MPAGDLHDVASFSPGDRLRRIDWRVTSRMNAGGPGPTGLYVRRSLAAVEATVMLVIDSRDEVGPRVASWGDAAELREDEATSLDLARRTAASIARACLEAGDRVGLEDLGRMRRPGPAAGGCSQLPRLGQWAPRVVAVDVLPDPVLQGLTGPHQLAYRIVAMERQDQLIELRRTGVELLGWDRVALSDDSALELAALTRRRAHR